MSKVIFSFCLLLILSIGGAYAQCAQALRTARTAYDEGQLQRIPSILESCLSSEGDEEFKDEDKAAAYRLLILTHIFMDEPEKADEAMLSLLRFNPQYKIDPSSDPAELINLYKTFRTWPIFHYGFKLGGNLTLIDVLRTFSVQNPNQSNGEYKLSPGFQIGLSVEIPINQSWILNPELYVNNHINNYVNNFIQIDSLDRFITRQEYRISQTNIMLPVTVQYKLPVKSRLNPYVFAGGSVSYIVDAAFNGQTNTSNESFEGATEDLLPQRQRLNFGAVLGSGIKLKVGKNQFLAEVRMNFGFRNQVDESQRFSNQDLIFDYGYRK